MSLMPVGQLGQYQAGGQPLEIVQMPGDSTSEAPGSWTNPGVWYSIASTSEHPKEAARFIDFMVNSPEAGAINKFDRGVPANSAVLKAISPDFTKTERQIADYYDKVAALHPAPFPRQNTKAGPVLIESVHRLTQEVLFGRLTPQKAADQLIAETSAAL